MITYIFGKTGAGKSYKAVSLIVEELKTRPVYSNIELTGYTAGYNYLHRDMMIDWLSFIELLYRRSQEDLTPEEEIYKQLRNRGISDCSIFIDEAHIYGFNNIKKKDFLMFFLSLQRHVNLNIILITQTRKQLHSLFHDLGDTVISCIAPTERISEKMLEYRYFSHVDSVKRPSDAFRTERLFPKKDIFDLYKSGENNKGDSGFRNKIKFLIGGMIVVVVFVIIQFKSLFTNKEHVDIKSSNINSISVKSHKSNYKSLKHLTFKCVSSICSNQESQIIFKKDDIKTIVKDTQSKILSQKVYGSSLSFMVILASEDFINMFKLDTDKHID